MQKQDEFDFKKHFNQVAILGAIAVIGFIIALILIMILPDSKGNYTFIVIPFVVIFQFVYFTKIVISESGDKQTKSDYQHNIGEQE